MKKTIFLLLTGWIVYFVIKVYSPDWITQLYHAQAFDVLNLLAQSNSPQTLDFYLGRIHETLFGPGLQVISFILLAVMMCRYCGELSPVKFTAVISIFLLMTKGEVLSFPPYGDAIGGPFAEAIWLANNHFDYAGLFHQPNFIAGGPKVYFFSLYPGLLALTIKLIPGINAFLAFHHLLTFILTAVLITLLRECARKVFSPVLAMLCALVLLALPLYQSQSEAINMEIPTAVLVMGCAYFLISKNWGAGAMFAILAAAVKGIGVMACAAVSLISLIVCFKEQGFKKKLLIVFWGLLPLMTGLFLGCAKFIFKDTHVQEGLVHWEAGWPSLKREFIFYLYAFSLIITVGAYLGQKFNQKSAKSKTDWFTPAVMFIFAAAWFILFLNFYAVSPRYRVSLYPFLIFCVFYSGTLIIKWETARRWAAVIVMLGACICSFGLIYGNIEDNDHVLLERSLEYRNDLNVNRRLTKIAQNKYNNYLIVAPFTIAQALAMPEMGYVDKKSKLNVMIYGFGLKYGGIANYPGLNQLDIRKTLFVGVKVAPLDLGFDYPVDQRDFIVEEVESGNKRATLFLGGFAIETLWRYTHGQSIRH